MDINKIIDTMKTINNQDSKALSGRDYNAPSMVSAPLILNDENRKDPSDIHKDLIKEALYKNFINAADKLRLNSSSKNVGIGFIDELVDSRMKELKNNPLNVLPSYVESTYDYLITTYTKKARLENARLNKIKGYDEASTGIHIDHNNIMKDFDKSIEKLTPDKIRQTVADRVEKATTDFIDSRNKATEQIKGIYNKVKSFVGDKETTEKDAKLAQESAKRQISKIKEANVGVFEEMVIALSNAAINKPELKNRYTNEDGSLNMSLIIDDTASVYAVMETSNILGLIKIDDSVIQQYINSLK